MTTLKTIAHIKSAFSSKFGIPRQSNLVKDLVSAVIFEPEYRDPNALRGLEALSHIWLIWGFSELEGDKWSPTVRPPRLGGNTRMGIFATRSPYRPNPIGLSSVKIHHIEQHALHGPVIYVLGADLMDGTPIYDLKPYLPYTDSHPDANGGFADEAPSPSLKVIIPRFLLSSLPEEKIPVLKTVLSFDPRPSYQRDPSRVYGMEFSGFKIKFFVEGDRLLVREIFKIEKK